MLNVASVESGEFLRRLVRAGIVTALVDGTFSSVLAVAAYGSTVRRLFQGVASTVLGSPAFDGGWYSVGIGMLMHVGVAFGWSAVFLLAMRRSRLIRTMISSPAGVVALAAVYGPAIWLVMSLVVIPALTHHPPPNALRWWVQLIGHFPFVGVPIVASSADARVWRRTSV
jgi:hypothetical protein